MTEFDKKSKALLLTLLAVITIAVFATYQRAFVRQDFEIVESEETEASEEETGIGEEEAEEDAMDDGAEDSL